MLVIHVIFKAEEQVILTACFVSPRHRPHLMLKFELSEQQNVARSEHPLLYSSKKDQCLILKVLTFIILISSLI